ncbi:hypothetical protein PS850_03527 [Pseudomonas fluorescens]|nr:hypothetical protein PS850_03527 [Pseudomonas fluorescens]
MRLLNFVLVVVTAAIVSLPAQAKNLSKNESEVCKWGAGVAGSAQHSKLSGVTLYSAKNNLKKRKYSKPWMPKMALGITEQTYKSRSRLKPAAVKSTYYEGCVKHELAKN